MSYLSQRRSGQVVSLSVVTGGSGYTAPPAVSFSGGGGTGAVATAHMAGTVVDSVVITNGGQGYTSAPTVTIAGNAQVTASVYAGPIIPASFVRSRFNDLYAFDGMGRGLRWDGSAGTMQPIGLQKPYVGPQVTIASTAMAGHIDSVTVVAAGQGYATAPTVTFSGGTPTKSAVAKATVTGGRVTGLTLTDPGAGYQSVPQVSIASSPSSGVSLAVGVVGYVQSVSLTNGGTGYKSAPTVTFSSSQGLTSAYATANISDGVVTSIDLMSSGTGATGPVTVSLSGGSGTGASASATMQYRVNAVTVANGGTGFNVAPVVSFRPHVSDSTGNGAGATAAVSNGAITAVTVFSGGGYALPPTAEIGNFDATAVATLSNTFRGTYKCAIRYIDATPLRSRGPVCSSISDLVEVKAVDGASQLSWSLSHAGLDDRVAAVELWRTTADQSVLLFKVATIQRSASNFSGTYVDTLSDKDLSDPTRADYALLPVTLPSGQLNARRFGVPPGMFSVACMFQDRLWLGVDTTGEHPNSLLYSEVDEPESIPGSNEIVIQENAGDSDALVALVPLGSFLLCVQSRHIYKLAYVAQPVIDASIMLVGYRGIINSRCWDVMDGVAYIADSIGLYSHDGNAEEALSVPVSTEWYSSIDFTQSSKFFVQCKPLTKVVRFFHCRYDNPEPIHALCYSTVTKTWWREQYAVPLTASAPYAIGGQQSVVFGTSAGTFVSLQGASDLGQPISYSLKTGNFELVNEQSRRGVTILYTPTADDSTLSLSQYYNGSSTARVNMVSVDRGDGFVVAAGGTQSTLNMKRSRSALGDATGVARAMFSGGNEERSAGSDRHVAIELSGTQPSSSAMPTLHSLVIEGAQ